MKMLPALTLTLAAALLAAPALSAAAGNDRPVDERRPLKADARVSVSNVAGEVEVEAWDRNELHLTGSLGEEVEALQIEGDASALSIKVKLPRNTRNSGDAHLHLKVPVRASLKVDVVSADVGVRGLGGDVEVEAVSGDARLELGSGKVAVKSVSGDIHVNAPAKDTRVASVSGDIHVEGVAGELRGESVSGDLTVRAGALKRLDLETVSGDLTLDGDLAEAAEVSVETLSGTILLRTSKAPAGRLEMETFSGNLKSEWSPGPARSERKYRNDGDGSGRIRLHSFSGDIKLGKR